jgi:hypothetical protein
MPTIKLTDIVGVMKDKWTYGDKFFGFTEEFNDNHNTQYPSILITPPTSVFPEVGLNNGWEQYTFEIYFSDLYNRTAQANEEIDQRWENLQDLATEWLDNFLKYYQESAPITAFLEDESVIIERNKEVANDQLLQLKLTFTWRVMSMCFRPQSTSPNQIPNLTVWLRADSGTTYSTPTKKVSAWADQSGNGNNTASPTSDTQPKRYTYNGASDKTRIEFDGITDYIKSDTNSPIGTDFTILTVAQATPVTPAFTNTYSTHFTAAADVATVGNPAGGVGGQLFSFTDGANNDQPFSISCWANIDPTEPWRGWVDKNEAGQQEYSFYPAYSSGYINARLFDNTTGGYLLARVTVSSAAKKGQWQHYVMTYDGSGSHTGIKIYIDGVESQDHQSTSGVYNGMQLTTSPLDLGNGNGNSYYGDLDETSVFNSELSQANITELYNLRNPTDLLTSTPSANLIGWWRMGDGATFPTIPDASTNSNDATMTSMNASDIRAFAPNSEQSTYLGYEFGNIKLHLGSSSGRLYCQVADAAQASGEWNARFIWDGDTSEYHIATMQVDSATTNLFLQYNDSTIMQGTMANYDASTTFNATNFTLGYGAEMKYLQGNIQEVVIYNRVLNSFELAKVKNYLNSKYKIY